MFWCVWGADAPPLFAAVDNVALALLSGEAAFLHRNTDVVRLRNAVTREMAD